jgi:hypothetical protein
MIRWLMVLAYPVLLLPLYLEWSRQQAEAQIDKMQRAVFNTPGAESPVPAPVLVVGAGLLGGYGLLSWLIGVKGWPRLLALVVGAPIGVAIFSMRQAQTGRQP